MRRWARHTRDAAIRRMGPSALVLTYHRVADLATDPQLLAVSPGNFAEQMRMLAQRHQVVTLPELISSLRHRRLEPGTIALTFDDGYADNLESAAPVLAEHGVPATVFVSSGCIERGEEFYWDEVERLVLGAYPMPPTVTIETASARFSSRVGPVPAEPPDPSWNVLQPDSDPRHHLYRELCGFVRQLDAPQRANAMTQLRSCVGAQPLVRPTHRPLTPAQVAEIDAVAGIEIGAHSRDHDVLALRSPEEQRVAIDADKAALEALCGHAIETFSYPYGGPSDFSAATVRIVEDAGFTGACANHPDLVKRWTDPFRLPRQVVRDWDAATLDGRIREWLGTSGRPTDAS